MFGPEDEHSISARCPATGFSPDAAHLVLDGKTVVHDAEHVEAGAFDAALSDCCGEIDYFPPALRLRTSPMTKHAKPPSRIAGREALIVFFMKVMYFVN